MGQKKTATDTLTCSTSQAQKLAKPWNKNALYLMGKKYLPLILFCKHLDSFSVSPSAKQKSHWHSHHLWFAPHMFQSAKIASSKNVLWLTKRELLGYAKEKVLHICNCTLVILIFNVC